MNGLIVYASSFLGKPYLWGGDDPIKGFDCSGYVLELLKAAGVVKGKVDMNSQGIHDFLLQNKGIVEASADLGDILFYGESNKKINHVAFAVTKSLMYEAGSGDSSVTSAEIAAQKNAFIRMRPIHNRGDLVAIIRPNYGV